MEQTFKLYNLGRISWWETQAVYAALAILGRSAVVFCEPDRPFYCLGYHQNAAELLDRDFCQANRIPVMRRELGGGLVYLHPGQYFYQVIMPKTSRLFTLNRGVFYRRFLEPVVTALQDLGVPACYQPIADIWAQGRKISGNGAGEIGLGVVLSGNVLTSFDATGFLAGLRHSSDLYSQVISRAVRELVGAAGGVELSYEQITSAIGTRLGQILGGLTPAQVDPELARVMAEIGRKYQALEWNDLQKSASLRLSSFKITEAVSVDYAPIYRDGLWWDLVGVWTKGSYTKIIARKGGVY